MAIRRADHGRCMKQAYQQRELDQKMCVTPCGPSSSSTALSLDFVIVILLLPMCLSHPRFMSSLSCPLPMFSFPLIVAPPCAHFSHALVTKGMGPWMVEATRIPSNTQFHVWAACTSHQGCGLVTNSFFVLRVMAEAVLAFLNWLAPCCIKANVMQAQAQILGLIHAESPERRALTNIERYTICTHHLANVCGWPHAM